MCEERKKGRKMEEEGGLEESEEGKRKEQNRAQRGSHATPQFLPRKALRLMTLQASLTSLAFPDFPWLLLALFDNLDLFIHG